MPKASKVCNIPTFEVVSSILRLDHDSGKLFWAKSRGSRAKAGEEAGSVMANGYRQIGIDGKDMLAHRLVWLLKHKEWPKLIIDHINGIRDDNRPSNLRDVTYSHNGQNMRKPKSNNKSTSTVPGVSFDSARGKWKVSCMIDRKAVLQKRFDTLIDAEKCVIAFRRENFAGNML